MSTCSARVSNSSALITSMTGDSMGWESVLRHGGLGTWQSRAELWVGLLRFRVPHKMIKAWRHSGSSRCIKIQGYGIYEKVRSSSCKNSVPASILTKWTQRTVFCDEPDHTNSTITSTTLKCNIWSECLAHDHVKPWVGTGEIDQGRPFRHERLEITRKGASDSYCLNATAMISVTPISVLNHENSVGESIHGETLLCLKVGVRYTSRRLHMPIGIWRERIKASHHRLTRLQSACQK